MTALLSRMEDFETFRLEAYNKSLLDYADCVSQVASNANQICSRLSLQTHDAVPSKQLADILKSIATNTLFDPTLYLDQYTILTSMRGDTAISTTTNHSAVDSEGFSIRPETEDIFKSPEQDNASKFKLAIQQEVIEEDVESKRIALHFVAAQLQSEASSLRKIPRTKTPSDLSNGSSRLEKVSPKVFNGAPLAPIPSETFDEVISTPQYSISIVETVNLYLNQGAVEKVLVTGEIHITVLNLGVPAPLKSKFVIQNVSELEKIVPNPTFVQPTGTIGEFELLMSHLSPYTNTPIPILKYQVADLNLGFPVIFKPMWKFSEGEANLLVQVELNELIASDQFIEFKLIAQVKADQIYAVQTEPIAVWDSESRTLLWNLNETKSTYLVAKIEATHLIPDTTRVRFHLQDCLMSKIEVVAPEINRSSKAIISGTYSAFNQKLE
jgi:hypothetical protein